MTFGEIYALRRALQTTAVTVAMEVREGPGNWNARLHLLRGLRAATAKVRFNLVHDLYEEGAVANSAVVQSVISELRGAEDFIDGVIACDTALALKEEE